MASKSSSTLKSFAQKCSAVMGGTLNIASYAQTNRSALSRWCFSAKNEEEKIASASATEELVERAAGASTVTVNATDPEESKILSTELIAEIKNDIVAEKKRYKQLLEKHQRSLADNENLSVRCQQQIEDAKLFGIQNLCMDLLEVADFLDFATDSVSEAHIQKNPELKTLYEDITRTLLLQILKRHGTELLDAINLKFDANEHQSIFEKDADVLRTNIAVKVVSLGYDLYTSCVDWCIEKVK